MIRKNLRPKITCCNAAALAVVASFALSGCGGNDDHSSASGVTAQQACDALRGKVVGDAKITSAQLVAATASLPSFCKVDSTIAPSLDIRLSLPNNWNGKLIYGGGGGYDGSVPELDYIFSGAAQALSSGYAIAQSNGGHRGNSLDASFATDPQLAYLFGSGSVPTATAAAKAMVESVYGTVPKRSYYEGCSNGGREGLMAVQRNPQLFDGAIVRAPAYSWTATMGAFNRNAKALAASPGAALSSAKVSLLAKAVRDACDSNDGVIDGVVSNPAACHFDPATLRCPGGAEAGDSCLSDAQLAVVTSWTTQASFSNGKYVYSGWALSGNEDDPGAWKTWLTGASGTGIDGLQNLFQDTTVKYYLAKNPGANSLNYVWDSNEEAITALAALNNATNTDLRPFMDKGAKLILWHGTADSALSYKATTEYYEGLKTTMGGQANVDKFVRYYLAPGVNHCSGGSGADVVNLVAALDKWVTEGAEPGQPVATKFNADGSTALTRPLCQYPKYPRYSGPAGDAAAAKDASNYVCTNPL